MNDIWNLDPIYRGFEDPAFEKDLDTLKEKVSAFASFAATLGEIDALQGLRTGIAMQEELYELVDKLAGYTSFRQATDTKDATAGSNMGRIMAVYSDLAAPRAEFDRWAANLPDLMQLVAGDEMLKEYTHERHLES